MKKITLILLLIPALLSGCAVDLQSASTPAQPEAAPQPTVKQVAGKIQQGRYLSKIGQKVAGQVSIPASFSVMVPQASHPSEYQYTQVSDQQGQNYTSVRFGPGWHDQTIYRVTVSKLPIAATFKTTADMLLRETAKRMKAIHQVLPIKLYQVMLPINQHQTLFAVYQQADKISGEVFTQAIYLWQQGHYMVECWLTGTDTSQINRVTGDDRLSVVKNAFRPFSAFVRSVKVVV